MSSNRVSTDDAFVRRLNLNLLYPLDAILHAPTLTEAGRRVHLSQSAMSHALKKLRDHFGDDLVTHAGGDQFLTPLGMALRGEVRRVMREVEGTFNYALDFDPLTSQDSITIATSEGVEQMLLGPVLRHLSRDAPNMCINLMPLDMAMPQQALEHGADLLLLPASTAVDRLETRPILSDHASCMVWSEHPDLLDQFEISEAHYRAARHIAVQGEAPPFQPLDAKGADLLKSRRICVRASSQATLPMLVVGSNLVATGSSWLFQSYASMMPLKVIPVPFASQWTSIVAQWGSHRRRDPMLAWFIKCLEERGRQLMGR
ncbi:LysR family transcriptional regulator [Niveispirillum sp. SYP-B3756]|uniref:LysR family transcriptional regulator n=1 Tax=Niveispirillum sp. SYP-B3756 TaxID=2662178 RepID=UPI001B3B7433|nr:LysR family transcriptional regulator [Niveispirillum sp. SYP-B3756]